MNKQLVIQSKERKEYIKRKKKNKVLVLFTQVFILIAFLGIWEILANKGIIDSFMMSQPSRIWNTLINLGSEDLMKHIWVTVYETIVGFSIGTILGIGIAILLWWSDFLSKVFEPYLVVLNSLPKVALRTSYNNLGRCRNTSNNCNGSLVVTILENLNGFLKTDKEVIKMAKTFNASKFQILTKIVIPANISTFINSLKVNIGLSLVGVISGEFLVSKAGLGYLIVYGGQVFKLDLVMASVIILGVVAGLMYLAVLLLEKFILKTKKFK